jgi:transcriptional regulator with XRE-family HTH domain
MTITPAQLKAARRLLSRSQADVSGATGLETLTIVNFERGERSPDRDALRNIQIMLDAARVEFTNGGEPGVKLKKAK